MSNTGLTGNIPLRTRVAIKNDEASATIALGSPVSLTLDGTDDGVAVVLPSSSAAKAHALAYGVALGNIIAGAYGEAQISGFVQKSLVLFQTRAASTDAWSASTHSLGVMLNVDTVNNAFSTSGGTLAKTGYLPWGVLGESTVVASSASGTADTRTAITGYMKAFLRML